MRYLLSISLLLTCVNLLAQQPKHAFLIYNVTGNVQVSINGKTAPAQKGQWLDGKEKMTIAKNAQVTLVCQSYNPVVISKKGTYTVSSFADSCKPDESFSASYFHYIWNEFSHESKTMQEEPRKYLKNFGAAVRGSTCVNMPARNLSTVNYYNGSFQFHWWGEKDSAGRLRQVVLQVFESDKKLLEVLLPQKNSYPLDSIAAQIQNPGKYSWTVKPADRAECARYSLNIVDKKQFDELSLSIQTTVARFTNDSAEQNFIMGFLFEEQHYPANAWYCYKQAAAANPSQLRYINTLADFESQYGLRHK